LLADFGFDAALPGLAMILCPRGSSPANAKRHKNHAPDWHLGQRNLAKVTTAPPDSKPSEEQAMG
jgi:hypothetical protein